MAINGMATHDFPKEEEFQEECNHQEKSQLQTFGVERFCSCEILA
jgi:hypothetical protein